MSMFAIVVQSLTHSLPVKDVPIVHIHQGVKEVWMAIACSQQGGAPTSLRSANTITIK